MEADSHSRQRAEREARDLLRVSDIVDRAPREAAMKESGWRALWILQSHARPPARADGRLNGVWGRMRATHQLSDIGNPPASPQPLPFAARPSTSRGGRLLRGRSA